MPERIPQSQAIRVPLQLVLTSDHVSAATGKTVTITISKNGAAYANPAAGATTATEIGSGSYYVDLAAADTNTPGPLSIKATATATDTKVETYLVVETASVSISPIPITPTGTNFQTPVDIVNRALQHCGQDMLDPALGFTENSARAREVSFAYPKLRRAELQRNVWRFAIKKAVLRAIDSDTMLLTPALWVEDTTYFVGSIVSDENNYSWISVVPDNAGNEPQNSLTWQQYYGPMTVSLWDEDDDTAYAAGELVYTTEGDGTVRVYLSLENGNEDDPSEATDWDDEVTYRKNQVVTYLSTAYMSKIDFNLDQTPTSSAADWASGTTYSAGQAATGSDGVRYTSVGNGNIGNDPTTDNGTNWTNTGILTPWTTSFTGGTGSIKWLQIGGEEFPSGVGLSTMNVLYPIGAGPASQDSLRNVFRLPAGFLRRAPRDPKAGSTSALGAPSNLGYEDWDFEGPWIISRQVDPIMFRFVADTVDVTQMDDMFCEGLGARIALEVCERLTRSSEKLKTIASVYDKFMTDARTVNAILVGSEEPPLDDYLACRA